MVFSGGVPWNPPLCTNGSAGYLMQLSVKGLLRRNCTSNLSMFCALSQNDQQTGACFVKIINTSLKKKKTYKMLF